MKITVLSTSDIHGYLYPTDFRERNQTQDFGLTKIINEIQQFEKINEDIVLKIDNGDFLQGSAFSYYLTKHPEEGSMADIMNQVGYDCGTLGNHEFNNGIEFLENTINKLNYPVVCANILKDSGEFFTGTPYTIFDRKGIKIAVLGLTTQYIPHWEKPKTIEGLVFKSAVETANEFVPKLREIADIVIVSYHGGFERDLTTGEPVELLTGENEGYALLHDVPGIDVLLTGHQHRYIASNKGQIPVTQPGDKGKFLGKVEIEMDTESLEINQASAELIEMTNKKENQQVKNKFLPLLCSVESWLDQILGKVLGDMRINDAIKVRMEGHPYIEFIQAVQKDATGVDISATALFDDMTKGFDRTITMRDIIVNYAYPSKLSVVSIEGSELKEAIEKSATYFDFDKNKGAHVSFDFQNAEPKLAHFNYDLYSGVDYTIDASRAKGDRVITLKYHEKDVEPNQRIEVVMSQYRAVGGGEYDMFSSDKIIREVSVDMAELILDYLKRNPIIEAVQPTNFILLDYFSK